MSQSKEEYLKAFWPCLPEENVGAIFNRMNDKATSKTQAHYYSLHESGPLELSDIIHRGIKQQQNLVRPYVIVVENVHIDWIATFGESWDIEPRFFVEHASNPVGLSPWEAVFPSSTLHERLVYEGVPLAYVNRKTWHIDGVFEYCRHLAESSPRSEIRDPNFFLRSVRYDLVYGWQVNTKMSCCRVDNGMCEYDYCCHQKSTRLRSKALSTDLFLVDASMIKNPRCFHYTFASKDKAVFARLHQSRRVGFTATEVSSRAFTIRMLSVVFLPHKAHRCTLRTHAVYPCSSG